MEIVSYQIVTTHYLLYIAYRAFLIVIWYKECSGKVFYKMNPELVSSQGKQMV